MSAGFCDSIGNTEWSQVGEEGIEIRIPAVLPDGVRPKDLSVCIKDSTILCISAGPVKIVEWRLHAPVFDESNEEAVEWVVENDHFVIDLKKKHPGTNWSCLLDLPIKDDDPLLVKKEQLDVMAREQFPVQSGEGEGEGEGDEEDARAGEASISAYLRHERANMRNTEKSIKEKIDAAKALKEAGDDSQDAQEKLQFLPCLEKMLEYNTQIMALRREPTSIDSFIKITLMGLQLARLNHSSPGGFTEEEEEEFTGEDEKALSSTELLTLALSSSDLDEPTRMHFLRLAAIHHGHTQSIAVLFGRYPTLPAGPFLMLKRALDDVHPSAEANHMVGDLFSSGSKFFVPLFPAAVYFYQRAAKLGYSAGMLSLAQMWSRGSTENSLLSEKEQEALKNNGWYHGWIQKAVDRGSGAALFVLGCMYLNGDHGVLPSYAKAKQLLEAAAKTGGEVTQLVRNTNVAMKLEELRSKEQKPEAASATETKKPEAPSAESKKTVANSSSGGAAPPSGAVVSAGESRINAFKQGGDSAAGVTRTKKSTGSAAAAARRMRFWEKAARYSLVAYGLFTVAFPIRVMLLPSFYSAINLVVQSIPWLANPEYTGVGW